MFVFFYQSSLALRDSAFRGIPLCGLESKSFPIAYPRERPEGQNHPTSRILERGPEVQIIAHHIFLRTPRSPNHLQPHISESKPFPSYTGVTFPSPTHPHPREPRSALTKSRPPTKAARGSLVGSVRRVGRGSRVLAGGVALEVRSPPSSLPLSTGDRTRTGTFSEPRTRQAASLFTRCLDKATPLPPFPAQECLCEADSLCVHDLLSCGDIPCPPSLQGPFSPPSASQRSVACLPVCPAPARLCRGPSAALPRSATASRTAWCSSERQRPTALYWVQKARRPEATWPRIYFVCLSFHEAPPRTARVFL